MLSYLNFRCYFEGNGPNHIHFLLKALLPDLSLKELLVAAKTTVSRKAGKLFRPEGKFKNHNLLHVNSSTVPSSQTSCFVNDSFIVPFSNQNVYLECKHGHQKTAFKARKVACVVAGARARRFRASATQTTRKVTAGLSRNRPRVCCGFVSVFTPPLLAH